MFFRVCESFKVGDSRHCHPVAGRAGCLGDGGTVEQQPGFRHADRYYRYDVVPADQFELGKALPQSLVLGVPM